jgi:hypothetical protein
MGIAFRGSLPFSSDLTRFLSGCSFFLDFPFFFSLVASAGISGPVRPFVSVVINQNVSLNFDFQWDD